MERQRLQHPWDYFLGPRRDRWAGDHSDHPSQSAAGKITIGKKRRLMQDTVMQSLPTDEQPTYQPTALHMWGSLFFFSSTFPTTESHSLNIRIISSSTFPFSFPFSPIRRHVMPLVWLSEECIPGFMGTSLLERQLDAQRIPYARPARFLCGVRLLCAPVGGVYFYFFCLEIGSR